MPAISYGRLDVTVIAIALTLIIQTVPMTTAKSLATERDSVNSTNITTNTTTTTNSNSNTTTTTMNSMNLTVTPAIFALPTKVDDDDVLAEYGRFVISAMNQSIDPCEDFYEYACGNWKKAELVPEKSRNDTFLHAIQIEVNEMLGKFLKTSTDDDADDGGGEPKLPSAESKAKLFYRSCVQMSKEMDKGYEQILKLEEFTRELKRNESTNETLDWISINFISNYGVYPLLPLKIHYETDSRKFDVSVGPPQAFLSNPSIINFKNLTRDFQIDDDEAVKEKFMQEFDEMIAFEKNLTSHVSRRNGTESVMLDDFLAQHRTDALNWTRYFDVAFNGTAKPEWTVHYTIDNIDKLVKFLNRSSLETMRTYVKWRTIMKFYYIWKFETRDGVVENACREHTEQYFNYALVPWFIENVYSPDHRADILHIAKHVKETFYELIDKYTWLDDETKSNAKTKLSSMDIQVGYSDDMRHRELINQVYNDVNMTEDWFKNIFTMEANRAKVRMRSVNKAIIPPLMSTRDVNAYYADFLNLAFIAIGIAQLPFYHMKFPASLKFGGIGNIIGHEMAHGFDSYCYQFNYDGKKQNWWTEGSLRNFRERYRCLESQYNKYIYRGVPTNGTLTSGDNIADNVGTRIAYYAYLNSHGKRDGDQKPIPGLDFTNKQLFFLKFAQTWCTGRDDTSKIRKIKTDAHAYEEFRVGGTLSNMPEFSEVFKCKLGSDMNPLKKCVVW